MSLGMACALEVDSGLIFDSQDVLPYYSSHGFCLIFFWIFGFISFADSPNLIDHSSFPFVPLQGQSTEAWSYLFCLFERECSAKGFD